METNTIDKKELIAFCIAQQQQTVETAKLAMEEAQREANDYGTPKDRYDGFRNQQLRKRDLQARQLQQALDNVAILELIDPEILTDKIGLGAIIVTDRMTFFIAIGMGMIQLNGQQIAVISPKVPVYHALRDKTTGETFEFNHQTYKILSIT